MPNKILLVYYSRTGITKKIAEKIASKLSCDIEAIKSVKNYLGPIGYLLAGREATLKKSAKIEPTIKNPADYDLIILGTPIWSFNISSPIRTYLVENKEKTKNLAAFCTMGGSGDVRAFGEMEKISGQKPITTLSLLTKEVVENKVEEKIQEFTNNLII